MAVLEGVDTFVQVVDHGSFASVAQRNGTTRSAVAKAIARLESRLGATLFQRTTRRSSLTADGEAFYEHARRALAEIDAAVETLEAGRREPTGRLRISAPRLLGRELVAPALAPLARLHRGLSIELSFDDRRVDLVEQRIDLAVRIGALDDSSSIVARRLGEQRFAIYASPAYLRRRGRPKSAADYAGHDAIVYATPAGYARWTAADGSRLEVAPRLAFDDVGAIADAALAGLGLARLPHWLAASRAAQGQLVELLADGQGTDAIHAIWPRSNRLPLKTRAAIDTLVARLPSGLAAAPAPPRRRTAREA